MTKEDENDDPAIGLLNEGENDEGEEIDPEDVKKNGWKFGWERCRKWKSSWCTRRLTRNGLSSNCRLLKKWI